MAQNRTSVAHRYREQVIPVTDVPEIRSPQCPMRNLAELAQDVIRQGIHLVGGGGLLRGLDQRLSRATGVPVSVVDAPLECVVLGAGRCIENYEVLNHLFMNSGR